MARSRPGRRTLAIAVLGLAALAVLSACDGDDDAAPPATLRPVDTAATVASASTTTTGAGSSTTTAGATTTGSATTASTTATSASSSTAPGTPTTIKGSGNVVERDYPLSGFTGVEASSSFTVSITRADDFEVTVKADDNVFDRLVVEIRQGALHIGVAPETTLQDVHLEATVTMPELTSLETAGAVEATVTGFATTVDRSIEAAGASTVTFAAPFAADGLQVEASGGSIVTLTGTANEATVSLSGGSQLDAEDLTADTAEFELSGGSEAEMTVTSTIDTAELSGGSRVTYHGSPTLGAVETSGGSQIEAA
jgi:hypothetical protein